MVNYFGDNMSSFDVAIIGAGPAGSTLARYMAEKGYKVAVIDKKKEIGVPLQCAGLLGRKIKELNVLPKEFIINEVNGAYLHSPSNNILKVSKKDTQAYVINRIGYDQHLAEIAEAEGAEFFYKHKVKSVNNSSGKIIMANQGHKELSAKVIVGADGHSSIVSQSFNKSSKTFNAAQYLIETHKPLETNFVELHVNSNISPGFIWSIPISETHSRIGLFGNHDYKTLTNFLEEFMISNSHFKGSNIIKKYQGKIPVFDPKKKLVHKRSILLGDAASQVKPTTGGGLLIGFACAKIASDVVSRALDNEKFSDLKDYESQFKKRYWKELKTQIMVQKTFELLNNNDLDQMFIKSKEKGLENIISEYGDMDSQSLLIKELFKRGLIFDILPKIVYRSVSQIWKFF